MFIVIKTSEFYIKYPPKSEVAIGAFFPFLLITPLGEHICNGRQKYVFVPLMLKPSLATIKDL